MQTTTPELQWLTIVQASRYLNLSAGFLRKLVRAREIPFARVGSKALRFRRTDLDRWMTANSVGSEDHAEATR